VLLAPYALASHPSGFVRARVCRRAVEPVISGSIPTTPARSRLQLKVVVDPCVIKKFQESSEDGDSNVTFTKCAAKSSNILRDSSSIHQNYSVEKKIFSNWLPKKRRPLDDVNRKLSSCLRLSRRIS
jgi:hypothetical protein